MRIAVITILLAAVACSPLPEDPATRGDICRDAFREYDRQVLLGGKDRPLRLLPMETARQSNASGLGAESKLLQFNCLLRPGDMPDLAAIDTAGLAKPAAVTPAPRQYVHLALVTNNADERTLRDFAESLGYNAGGKGVKQLGRRVFLGPFSSVEEQQAALNLAEALGIRSAYLLTQVP
jgi:hypothetical protein